MNIKKQNVTTIAINNDLIKFYKSSNNLFPLYKHKFSGHIQQKKINFFTFSYSFVGDPPYSFFFLLCNNDACNYFAREMYAMLFFTKAQQTCLSDLQSACLAGSRIMFAYGTEHKDKSSFVIITFLFNTEKLNSFIVCNFNDQPSLYCKEQQVICGEIKTMHNPKEKVKPTKSTWIKKPILTEKITEKEYEEKIALFCLVAESIDAHSEQMLKLLIEFKKEQNHCIISADHPNRRLISWIKWLRLARQKGILLPNKIAKLTALGFIWRETEDLYQQNIIKLKRFIDIHGHGYIPANYREDPVFGFWATETRRNERLGRLSVKRKAELDLLGFAWGGFTDEIISKDSIDDNLVVGASL